MNSVFLAGGMLGLALGMAITFPLALLYAHHVERKNRQSDLMAANILRGYGTAIHETTSVGRHAVREPIYVEDNWLTDDVGAFEQAKAAAAGFMPYPGNTGKLNEPDEAWLAWLADGRGRDYWTGREHQGDLLDPPPVTAWVTWGRTEQALARLALIVLSTTGGVYPWWQKIADRVWEWFAVAEWSGIRVNRAIMRGFELWFEATVWGMAVLGGANPNHPPVVHQRRPAIRPKRLYPAKLG